MVDGEARPGPARTRFLLDASEHAQRHLGVRLVVEPHHRASAVAVADRAHERDHRAAIGSGHRLNGRVDGKRPVRDAVRSCAARDRRNERDFRPIAQRLLAWREFLIDREAQLIGDRAQARVCCAGSLACIGGSRAVLQLDGLAPDAGALARGSEIQQSHPHPSSAPFSYNVSAEARCLPGPCSLECAAP